MNTDHQVSAPVGLSDAATTTSTESESEAIKTNYADTLNALHDMQESIIYAARRGVLADAERIIVCLEQELKAARASGSAAPATTARTSLLTEATVAELDLARAYIRDAIHEEMSEDSSVGIFANIGLASGLSAALLLLVGEVDARARAALTRPAADAPTQEAIAEVGPGFTLLWAGSEPIATLLDRHPGVKVGSKLYAARPAADGAAQTQTPVGSSDRAASPEAGAAGEGQRS